MLSSFPALPMRLLSLVMILVFVPLAFFLLAWFCYNLLEIYVVFLFFLNRLAEVTVYGVRSVVIVSGVPYGIIGVIDVMWAFWSLLLWDGYFQNHLLISRHVSFVVEFLSQGSPPGTINVNVPVKPFTKTSPIRMCHPHAYQSLEHSSSSSCCASCLWILA